MTTYSDEYIKKHNRDNLVLREVGEFIVKKTKDILKQEGLKYDVVLKPRVYKTCKNGLKRHIQYGEVCVGSILQENIFGSPAKYFVVNGGKVKHLAFNNILITKLDKYDRLSFVMLEEIAHCFPNRDSHGKSFRLKYKYLYNKYFKTLSKSLRSTIEEIEQRGNTKSQKNI